MTPHFSSRFQLFKYSLLLLFFTLLCSLLRRHLQSLYYRELFIKRPNLKEREVNIRSSRYGSSSERVAFGLSLESSSSELMNARIISLESSSSPWSMVSLSYSLFPLSSVSMLSALALLSFCANVLTILSVGCPAVRGLFCYKHERLSIVFTLSLLLLFKCYLSPWWSKYLFSSGRRSFLSFVTSSPHITVLI